MIGTLLLIVGIVRHIVATSRRRRVEREYPMPGVLATTADVRATLDHLRQAVAAADLDDTASARADTQFADLDAAIRVTPPDQSRFARALQRLTRLLAAAGSLVTTGAALVSPLQALATWLGALGQPVLHLLPALG
jgi:hypothetical protein